MRKAPRPDVGGVGPKLEKRFIQRQPQSSSKAESPKQAADRRPGWDCWGNEIDKFEHKPRDDFSRSIEECYRVIRERVAAGGPKWVPK